MKTLCIILLSVLTLGLQAQMVSDEWEEKLSKRHPKATAVEWVSGEEYYTANFQEGDRKLSAYFDQKGNWKKTIMEIDVADLPHSFEENLPDGLKIIAASKIVSTEQAGGRYILKLEGEYTEKAELLKAK